jgi:hypothetical protein
MDFRWIECVCRRRSLAHHWIISDGIHGHRRSTAEALTPAPCGGLSSPKPP